MGDGSSICRSIVVAVNLLYFPSNISTGFDNSTILDEDGKVYSWGKGISNGFSDEMNKNLPIHVYTLDVLSGLTIIK